MHRLRDPHPPPLEQIEFKSLYRKEIYDARTRDGWVLQVSRYRPLEQEWEQPILGEPLLLVPGWSQNRHAFTCATFVKRLLVSGADCHIAELRGHGRSSRELQIELCGKERRPLPRDLDWEWDLDSYLLEDVPAAVQAVKARTHRDKVVYLGNSMGGMLGYGYAGSHRDLAGLVTIGAPSDLGRGFLLMRAAALFGPAMLGPLIDALCAAATGLHPRQPAPLRVGRAPLRFPAQPRPRHGRGVPLAAERRRGEGAPKGGGAVRAVDPARRDEVLSDGIRLQGALQGDRLPHGRAVRRPGQDRLRQEHQQHLPQGAQRVLPLATGEGQLPPRAHRGLRLAADLRGRDEPGGIRRAP